MIPFKIKVFGFVDAEIGQNVKLPLNEEGIINDINTKTLDWFPIKVKITKGVFNRKGSLCEFKPEQIEKIYEQDY